MAADLLEQGSEHRPARSRSRALAIVLTALVLVTAGVLQGRGDAPAERTPSQEPDPPPRLELERAEVLSVRETLAGVLHLRIGVEGPPRARLESVAVDLPGSALAMLPAPDRLTDDGTALLVLDLLPRCPDALAGLSRGAVTAVMRGRDEAAPARRAKVDLDTSGGLADAVRTRCGTVVGVPDLRTSDVVLDGPAGDPLQTRVTVSAAGTAPVTVVAVRPGPGLHTTLRTPLPVAVSPGGAPASVRVDLRLEGCGGASDTPPYLLVLSTGEAVATSVAPEVRPHLEALRPEQCAGDLPSGGT